LAIVLAMTGLPAHSQQVPQFSHPPLSFKRGQYYLQHPAEYQQLLQRMPLPSPHISTSSRLAPGQAPVPGSWTSLTSNPGQNLSNPLLLTDGTVIAHVSCTTNWFRLTPDIDGSYLHGTWTKIASLPPGYTPRFFGSAVLPDGRVIVEGGEYNNGCNPVWTTQGAIYDPVANTWTTVNPPPGWTSIGDAPGIVLNNGTYMQTSCCDNQNPPTGAALLNATNLTWTPTGTGKFDEYDEEGLTKLPNGNVLAVDAYVNLASCGRNSEIYNKKTGTWSSAGNTPDQQADCNGFQSDELGPLVLRPDGMAIIFPGVTTGVVTADIYDTATGTWSTGTQLPSVCGTSGTTPCTLADAPAAVLPSGNILFAASGSWTARDQFPTPTNFFELDLAGKITQVPATADAANVGAWQVNFLLLPTGQVLEVSTDDTNVQIYTPAGSPKSTWQPVVHSVPSCLARGKSYVASGTQFNGLTEGSYYGDDVNAATNFPLVRIVNNQTKHMFYARTFHHSSRSIAPNSAESTNFTVAAATETGPSTLYVVANGIASAGMPVKIKAKCAVAAVATAGQ
jgi:hypothetical protein